MPTVCRWVCSALNTSSTTSASARICWASTWCLVGERRTRMVNDYLIIQSSSSTLLASRRRRPDTPIIGGIPLGIRLKNF